MRDLSTLGFTQIREVCELSVLTGEQQFKLPDDYLTFLSYEPPEDLNLSFKFIESTTSQEWEGQVIEFLHYTASDINQAVVAVPDNPERILLPISVDAGGNYSYMDLTSASKQIIDVGYGTGAISFLAETFGDFIDMLQVEDE